MKRVAGGGQFFSKLCYSHANHTQNTGILNKATLHIKLQPPNVTQSYADEQRDIVMKVIRTNANQFICRAANHKRGKTFLTNKKLP